MNTANTPKVVGIKEACAMLELSEVYVRRMIQHGKIQTEKVEIKKNTFKHMITVEEIERWRSEVGARSRREDHRSKFVLYATQDELQAIQTLLDTDGIEAVIERANKVKNVA